MGLKPQNIIQAAEADLARHRRNAQEAQTSNPSYEQYAFHRNHVRKSETPQDLIRLALMNPSAAEKTVKANTKLIYGNAALLIAAIRSRG